MLLCEFVDLERHLISGFVIHALAGSRSRRALVGLRDFWMRPITSLNDLGVIVIHGGITMSADRHLPDYADVKLRHQAPCA